jgi:hypothetical protein
LDAPQRDAPRPQARLSPIRAPVDNRDKRAFAGERALAAALYSLIASDSLARRKSAARSPKMQAFLIGTAVLGALYFIMRFTMRHYFPPDR